ncbi:hypothetical protein PROFUN_06513 [Planoprotostelium fungivorum]|uniref:Thioredoxin domain-containing protein n=1 Tax=Planoprotostelium fungivorum TaxID=1890364 RepID=A0A2P6NNZ6_9EUKA|nr:hypothetical protein PROFUN_06513 [Planoprotostelium fungivorum]
MRCITLFLVLLCLIDLSLCQDELVISTPVESVRYVNDSGLRVLIDQMEDSEQFMFVKFKASWCPFSQQLTTIFEAVAESFPNITFASIDASRHTSLNYRYDISTFPKLVLFRGNGSIYTYRNQSRTFRGIQHYLTNITGMQPIAVTEPEVPPLRLSEETDYFWFFSVAFVVLVPGTKLLLKYFNS